MRPVRPANLCRSRLFLEGANAAVLGSVPSSGADVLIQELEDFTPPSLRPGARAVGQSRAELHGSLVELPTYTNAKGLLARADGLRQFTRGG